MQGVHAYVHHVRCCICWNLVLSFNDSHAFSPGKNVHSIWPLCTLHSGYLHRVDYVWFLCSSGLSWRSPVMDQNCRMLLLYLFPYWPTVWCFPVPILYVKGSLTLCYRLCCDKIPYHFFLLLLLLLLSKVLQLQRSFVLLNECLPFGPVSDAVLPVCYFRPCYVAPYIILPSIFWSS